MSEDFPGGKAAKRVVLIGRDLAKSVLPRHLVERAGKPGAAVGDGAVEIKNGKDAVSHTGFTHQCRTRLSVNGSAGLHFMQIGINFVTPN